MTSAGGGGSRAADGLKRKLYNLTLDGKMCDWRERAPYALASKNHEDSLHLIITSQLFCIRFLQRNRTTEPVGSVETQGDLL